MGAIATCIGLGIAFFLTRHFNLSGWQWWLTWIGCPVLLSTLVGVFQGLREAKADMARLERAEELCRSGVARRDFENIVSDLLGDREA